MMYGLFAVILSAALISLCSSHDHMMRPRYNFADLGTSQPFGPTISGHAPSGHSSSGHGIPWQHKTSFQVSNGHQWTGGQRSDSFKATLNHDIVGGKNWGAGGYVTHERTNKFRDGNTHGGVKAHLNF